MTKRRKKRFEDKVTGKIDKFWGRIRDNVISDDVFEKFEKFGKQSKEWTIIEIIMKCSDLIAYNDMYEDAIEKLEFWREYDTFINVLGENNGKVSFAAWFQAWTDMINYLLDLADPESN